MENDSVGHINPKSSSSLSDTSSLNKQDGKRHSEINYEGWEDNTMTNLNSHIDVTGTGTTMGTTIITRRRTQPILPLSLDLGFDLRQHLSVDGLWTRYRSFARQNYIQLDIADDVVSRILFWLPHHHHQEQQPSTTSFSSSRTGGEKKQGTAASNIIDSVSSSSSSSSSPYWREVMYGLLSLHRLMLSLALQQEPHSSTDNSKSRLSSGGYGMTVRTQDEPCIPAVKVRILLTVIQSILPSILAVAEATVGRQRRQEQPSNKDQGGDNNGDHSSLHLPSSSSRILTRRVVRMTRVKLYIEQLRLFLRMYLLCNYWKQQEQQQQRTSGVEDDRSPSSSSSSSSSAPFLGILMDAGIYYATDQEGSDQQQNQQEMSWEEADAIARREAYVGQRTGWRQYQNSNAGGDDDKLNRCHILSPRPNLLSRMWRVQSSFLSISESSKVKLAEVLHVARPVIWAWFESKYCLATLDCDDEASLVVSSPSSSNTGNRTRSSSTSKLSNSVRRDRRGLLRAWILCLGMDVLSTRMLQKTSTSVTAETRKGTNSRISRSRRTTTTAREKTKNQNEDYMYEIHRRKMALFLYLLRCPVWNTFTSPILLDDGGVATAVFRRIPVVGRLLETALYDWVMYYKWLALEEG